MFFLTSFYWLTLRLLVFGTKNTGTFIVVLLESGSQLRYSIRIRNTAKCLQFPNKLFFPLNQSIHFFNDAVFSFLSDLMIKRIYLVCFQVKGGEGYGE